MSLVKFVPETPSQDDFLLARLNEVYSREDSSLDPSLMMAQLEAIGEENSCLTFLIPDANAPAI